MVNPRDIKLAGDNVPSTAVWEQNKEDFMRSIVYKKFSQNEDLKQKLIATQNLTLYECTGNRWWGSGNKLDSPEWATTACTGLNKMGAILMDVRKALRKRIYNNDALTKSPGSLIKLVQRHNQIIHEDMADDDFPTPVLQAPVPMATPVAAAPGKNTETMMETEEVEEDSSSSLTDTDDLMDPTDAEEDSVNISASSSVTSTASVSAICNVMGSDGKLVISKILNWFIPKVNELHHSLRASIISARNRRQQLRNTLSTDTPLPPTPQAASTPHPARMNQSELVQCVRGNLHPAPKKKKENP